MAKTVKRLEDVPEVREARERLASMQMRVTDARHEIERLSRSVSEDDGGKSRITAAAEALLAGTGGAAQLANPEHLSGVAREAHASLRIATEAVRLQRGRLDEIESRASRQILAAEAPRHRALAEKVAGATLALGEAVTAILEWQDEIESAGMSPGYAYETLPSALALWRPSLDGGRFTGAIEWCVAVGALTKAEASRPFDAPREARARQDERDERARAARLEAEKAEQQRRIRDAEAWSKAERSRSADWKAA